MNIQEQKGLFKKPVQQGRRAFGAQSVQQYVSTTKARERRWRTFSTAPH